LTIARNLRYFPPVHFLPRKDRVAPTSGSQFGSQYFKLTTTFRLRRKKLTTKNLTVKWINSLSTEKKILEIRDEHTKGLALRVYPTGKKTWYVIYRMPMDRNGKRYRLARYEDLTLGEAREKARNIITGLQDGIDPRIEKKKLLLAETVEEVISEYNERVLSQRKTGAEIKRILDKDIKSAWGPRKLRDLNRRDIRSHIEKLATRAPIVANRTLAHFSAMLNWAVDQEIIDSNPAARLKPPSRETSRDRVLAAEEIKTFWNTMVELPGASAAALRLILVTGQRSGEVVGMEWSEIDLKEKWWTIPAHRAKNGLAHRVPLSDTAMEIIKKWDNSGRFLFSSETERAHIAPLALSHYLRRHEKKLDMPKFHPHDLRRTAASYMASAGVNRLVIGKILNHVESGITAVYDRHSYDREKQQAMATWEQKLRNILTGEKAEVVHLMKG
jgi:integrase